MRANPGGRWVILLLSIICVGMIGVFSDMKSDNQAGDIANRDISGSASATGSSAAAAIGEESTEEEYVEQIDSYPYYGMREADLNHCLLGKPDIVVECSNFDKRRSKDKDKYYYFGYGDQKNSGKIIVRYALYNDQGDGYEILPDDNGYVDSGYYIDEDGVEYRIYGDGVHKAEEESEATTEETNRQNGGRLPPRGGDDGPGSSSGSSSGSSPGSSSGKPGTKGSGSDSTEFDPEDHDIDGYYEDNKDDFESIDDAYEAFEDDEDAWDDY